ncbi:hypothetical protein PIB30_022536 [Stylosanthes scabra]|uniref:Uncharacterized protein n=1 Tax=Stylosanthes scabra TaxID=79078 RepID=A0ABU6W9A5_9FABA|nr:hypothetical protein [Stylosanthes scabra]
MKLQFVAALRFVGWLGLLYVWMNKNCNAGQVYFEGHGSRRRFELWGYYVTTNVVAVKVVEYYDGEMNVFFEDVPPLWLEPRENTLVKVEPYKLFQTKTLAAKQPKEGSWVWVFGQRCANLASGNPIFVGKVVEKVGMMILSTHLPYTSHSYDVRDSEPFSVEHRGGLGTNPS